MTTSSTGTQLSLLARARGRDPAAWSDLVRLYAPLIAHWCRRCGLDPHDTADCVQDVFASVATALVRYRPADSSGAFRGWLWTITRNKVRDQRRRRSHQPRGEGGSTAARQLAELADEQALPEDEPSDAGVLSDLVRRGLEQVRAEFEPASWQSFWRTAIDGIPTAVAAQQLGLTSAAVRQNRSRIMRRLRQQLGDSG
ncbi:MAG: RNA polymerase sigma factor [Pirellulaceae bacterium]